MATISKSISVTNKSGYLLTINVVPTGSSVTPVNDIQTWLHCADIWDKSYTTISQVLADSTTLLALISSNNAADYMARSTNWASSVCANSTAMSYIGNNNYCADKLLAVSAWNTAICNSTYFESVLKVKVPTMTSNTTPSGVVSASTNYGGYDPYKVFDGNTASYWCSAANNVTNQYIEYQFPSAVSIRKVRLNNGSEGNSTVFPKNCKLQYYNGSSYVDIKTFVNNTAVNAETNVVDITTKATSTKWRLLMVNNNGHASYVYLAELQFYGRA